MKIDRLLGDISLDMEDYATMSLEDAKNLKAHYMKSNGFSSERQFISKDKNAVSFSHIAIMNILSSVIILKSNNIWLGDNFYYNNREYTLTKASCRIPGFSDLVLTGVRYNGEIEDRACLGEVVWKKKTGNWGNL